MRGPVMDLYGAAADAGAAGVGAVHVGERLSRNRALRRSLQLVPVPGELLRPRALRVDARELEPAAERQGRSLCRQAPQAQVREMRRAAVLPEKGERRGDPARGLREISLGLAPPW